MGTDPVLARKHIDDAVRRASRTFELLDKESAENRSTYERFHNNWTLFSGGTVALSITYLGYLKSLSKPVASEGLLIASWATLLLCLGQIHSCCIATQNARKAPEGRKSLAHGASRGWERPRRISPGRGAERSERQGPERLAPLWEGNSNDVQRPRIPAAAQELCAIIWRNFDNKHGSHTSFSIVSKASSDEKARL